MPRKKPNKFKKSSNIDDNFVKVFSSEKNAEQISKDIDRMFPRHKEGGAFLNKGIWLNEYEHTSYVTKGESTGMVLERGNYDWTPEELAVARAKGIKINE